MKSLFESLVLGLFVGVGSAASVLVIGDAFRSVKSTTPCCCGTSCDCCERCPGATCDPAKKGKPRGHSGALPKTP